MTFKEKFYLALIMCVYSVLTAHSLYCWFNHKHDPDEIIACIHVIMFVVWVTISVMTAGYLIGKGWAILDKWLESVED